MRYLVVLTLVAAPLTIHANTPKQRVSKLKPYRYFETKKGTKAFIRYGWKGERRVVLESYVQLKDGTLYHKEVGFRRMLGHPVKDVRKTVQRPDGTSAGVVQTFGQAVEGGYGESWTHGARFKPLTKGHVRAHRIAESPLSPLRWFLTGLSLYSGSYFHADPHNLQIRNLELVPKELISAKRTPDFAPGEHFSYPFK